MALAHARPQRSANGHGYVYHGANHRSFVVDRYAWPRGQSYRRLEIGASLPQVFWEPQYYIDDYDYYGVAPPPPNYRWVRYGADLVLLNQSTGRIADRALGMFQEGSGGMNIAYAGAPTAYDDPEELADDPPPPR